ncbi:MAG TPA: M20/M25/M40 family metallo-hydrolase [Armatimonadota bacterium]|nr:M20/M25/M40 family metallo-hydrolase [Armatimonadota bacterium]
MTLLRIANKDVLGLEPEVKGLAGFGDARFYWNMAKIPSVMYGAGTANAQEANAHGPDENLSISDLVKAAKVIALTTVDLLGEVKE